MSAQALRILVADDELTTRLLLKSALEKAGYEVLLAEDGPTALSLFRRQPCTMVMLDVEMPGLNGDQVCRQLRQEFGLELPILMVTAMDDMVSIDRAFEAGATDFIRKPINWPLLGYRIRYLLRGYQVLQDLNAANARNAAMLSAMPDSLLRLDTSGRVLDAGLQAPARADHLLPGPGQDLRESLPPGLAAQLLAAVANVCASERAETLHYALPPGGVQSRHFEARLARISHDQALCLVRDVTELAQTQHALTHALQFTRGLLDSIQDGFSWGDLQGVLQDANPAFCRITGFSREELVGTGVPRPYWPPEEIERLKSGFASVKAGDTASLELTLMRKNGERFPALLGPSIVRDPSGVIIGYGVTLKDISDRKAAENLLLAAKTEAEQTNLAKSRFLVAASHDLRQPLQAISLFSYVLSKTRLDAEQRSASDYLVQSVKCMSEMLDALLDISRLDTGSVTASMQPVDGGGLKNKLRAEFGPAATAKSLRLRIHFPKRDIVMQSDEKLLMSLLGNLIGNAIKYTERGGILVSLRRRGGRALIQVWDSGVGIAPEHMSSIFEEYFQVNNPARDRSQGLGLGLSIARRVARLLDTSVLARSVPGRGSVFAFSLPLVPLPAVAPSSLPASPALQIPAMVPVSELPELAARHIVLVDDDATLALALKMALKSLKARITTFGSGEAALATPGIEDADFFISDYRLPGMNGVKLLDTLQQRARRPIKALLLTGDVAIHQGEGAGGQRWKVLFKPIDRSDLIFAMASQGLDGPSGEKQ